MLDALVILSHRHQQRMAPTDSNRYSPKSGQGGQANFETGKGDRQTLKSFRLHSGSGRGEAGKEGKGDRQTLKSFRLHSGSGWPFRTEGIGRRLADLDLPV
jgi:hypothetical protein